MHIYSFLNVFHDYSYTIDKNLKWVIIIIIASATFVYTFFFCLCGPRVMNKVDKVVYKMSDNSLIIKIFTVDHQGERKYSLINNFWIKTLLLISVKHNQVSVYLICCHNKKVKKEIVCIHS